MPVIAEERPFRGHAPVVEDGLADELDLDAPVEAQGRAHQHVVAVVVGRRTRVRGDGVLALPRAHRRASRTRIQPLGVFHVVRRVLVPGLVGDASRVVDAERPEPERASLAVEQRAEHAG